MKNAGYIIRSARAVWSLTDKGNKVESVNKEYVKKKAKIKLDEEEQEENYIRDKNNNTFYDSNSDVDDLNWQARLLEVIKGITPEKFENLCQRILRELGFNNVVVTGKSHDGGIDGMGILRLGEVLSFRVAFQAKRYDGTVGSSIIRDFRGAMMGRANKGLIITTGAFSRNAVKEATRDGATPIDLIDGNELAKHLKKLGLGVEVEIVEKVIINEEWFKNI